MARVSTIITNFTSGEITPRLYGRIDASLYNSSVKQLENMLVYPQGGATRRSGTKFAGTTKDGGKVRLMPFEFSDEQAYVFEFGNTYVRFFKDGGLLTESVKNITGISKANPARVTSNGHGFSNGDRVFLSGITGMVELNNREFTVVSTATNTFDLTDENSTDYTAYNDSGTAGKIVEITTTYNATDIFQINFAQSADVIYLAHPSHEPAKITRTSSTAFAIADVAFVDGPYEDENITGTTITAGANTGSMTLTASADLFASTDIGSVVRFRDIIEVAHDEWLTSATYSQNDIVRFNGNVYKKTDAGSGESTGLQPPVHTSGSEVYGNHTWQYQHSGTGYCIITAVTNATTATATVQQVAVDSRVNQLVLPVCATGGTTRWSRGAFSLRKGFPKAVAFYEERLFFAGTTEQPQTIFGSVSGDFENQTPSTEDDGAINVTIASDQVNVIKHLIPARFLQILTTSSEFTLSGGTGSSAVTPTNVNVLRETTFGTSSVRPVRAGTSTIMVQKGTEKVKEITFNLDADGLVGRDLTVLAEHITRGGLTDMVWQQEPELILWFVRADGNLVGLSYDPPNNTVAWHDHKLGGVSQNCTITVSDFSNIAVGTTLTFTKGDGSTVTFTSEAVSGDAPVNANGFRPNEANNTTADNLFTAINAHEDFYVANPSAAVVTIQELKPVAGKLLTVVSSDTTRLATTNELAAIVESITAIPSGAEDEVYLSVKRIVNLSVVRHIERLTSLNFSSDITDCFYVDSGLTYDSTATSTINGLAHLEGESLSILADGSIHPNKVVSQGIVTLDRNASTIQFGYNYESVLETLELEAGAEDGVSQGKIKRIHGATVRFLETVGAELGADINNLDRIPFRDSSMNMDEAVPLFTGDKEISFPSGYDNNPRIVVRQNQPLPMTISAIMRRSNTFDA